MKKFIRFLVSLVLIAAIIASVCWYLFVYDRNFTRDMLLSQARYNDMYGNSRLSSWFYNMAYEHSGRDENVAIELANQYKADRNYTKAEVTLSNAIKNRGTVELYTALCKTYVEQDKLMDAVAFLNSITDPAVKAELDALRPTAPAVSHEPGYYSQYIDVAITSSGTLYYTTDGEYPSIAGPVYDAPLALDAGETVIYAISVADSGLVSNPVVAGYTIGGVIEPVDFTDPEMEAAIRENLGVRGSEILYTNVLWDITEFTVPAGAKSMEDLKLMPYLTSLTISDQQLDSLSILSSLTKLQKLNLTGSSFPSDDLAVLAVLPALTDLTLANCGLSTIAGLKGAERLVRLDLSGNTVRNMESLTDMTTLKELYLQHNAVTGLEVIGTLVNLEKLDISFNSVTNLEPLTPCWKLNWLCADNNSLTALRGVDSLALLSYLSVDHNKIKDISTAAACSELNNLSFANNEVSDISSLAGLLKLEILDFSYNTVQELPQWQEGCTLRTIDGSYNKLKSIDSLATLPNISYVYMDYNEITNVDALAECYVLVQVNVYGNDIDSVSELTAHDIIVNYDPT